MTHKTAVTDWWALALGFPIVLAFGLYELYGQTFWWATAIFTIIYWAGMVILYPNPKDYQ